MTSQARIDLEFRLGVIRSIERKSSQAIEADADLPLSRRQRLNRTT